MPQNRFRFFQIPVQKSKRPLHRVCVFLFERLPFRNSRARRQTAVQMRRKAVERSIACLTSLDTANALANCLKMNQTINDVELVDITKI